MLKQKSIWLIALIAVLLMGCSALDQVSSALPANDQQGDADTQPAAEAEEAQAVEEAEPTATIEAIEVAAEPTEAPPPTEAPAEETVPEETDVGGGAPPEDVPLNPSGPWLTFLAGQDTELKELWIANPDGSGLTQVASLFLAGPRDFTTAVAPTGNRVAVITQLDATNSWKKLTLYILSLPSGEVEAQIPLTSEETEPTEEDLPFDPSFEVLRSIAELDSLAWSPDGTKLAFMGAQSGPSSDLFVYDANERTLLRLTDGPSQGIRPTWSPDGKYILHLGVNSLGTGAGYSVDQVWAAAADGSEVFAVDTPTQSGDIGWIGWAAPDTPIMYHWDPLCGRRDLRTVNVTTGDTTVLWDGYFSDAAYDPDSGQALLSVENFFAEECLTDAGVGHFLVAVDGTGFAKVSETEGITADWSEEAEAFIGRTGEGQNMVINPDGTVQELLGPSYSQLILSPTGSLVAWASTGVFGNSTPGVWVGSLDGTAQNQVSEDPFVTGTFSPDGTTLLLFGDESLYVATAPDFRPLFVQDGLYVGQPDAIAWTQ